MADKKQSNRSQEQEEVKGQSVQYIPDGELHKQKQTEVVNVSATSSTMNINGANNANSNRPTEAEMKRELEYAKAVLSQQKTKSVSIPKQMAQYVGETLPACINGACVRVPVDGESYDVPEAYYPIIMNSLKTIHAGDVRDAYGFGDKVGDDALKR